MKNLILIPATILFLVSCNKDDNNPDAPASCSTNTGSFDITLGGNSHQLVTDTETQFTILYNWFDEQNSSFVLAGKDQNGVAISVESALAGELNEGTINYNSDNYGFDFMDLDVGSNFMYVSDITFDVLESDLSGGDGIYRPLRSTFTGTAHSYPWTNGEPAIDTMAFSGSFCLNGIVQ
jgi:hypothetical protein